MNDLSTRLGRRTVRRRSLGLCTKCGKVPPAPNKERCENCSNLEIIRLRNERKRLRKEVISHYSPDRKCTCCGESNIEFLTIDHINGGGGKDRKLVNQGGTGFLRHLKKNNYPDGFQVLCWNCNLGRAHYGICPHKDR